MEQSKWKLFWSQRPPFLIFLLCLASFGLTLFSLSVFVAQKDKIQNPDVLDWNKLLVKMTKLEFCLPSKESNYNLTTLDWTSRSDWTNVTLSVLVSEDFSNAFYQNSKEEIGQDTNKLVRARAQIDVKNLGRGIRPEFMNDIIIVSFELPQPNSQNPWACLEVQGPKSLLKHLRMNDTTCTQQLQGDFKNIALLAHSPDHKPASWCHKSPSDLPVHLDFEMEFNPDLTMYVTAQDKELIHLHLMVTSVFLFAVLAIVIITFLIKTVNANRKSIDSRGDHHIIMTQFTNEE